MQTYSPTKQQWNACPEYERGHYFSPRGRQTKWVYAFAFSVRGIWHAYLPNRFFSRISVDFYGTRNWNRDGNFRQRCEKGLNARKRRSEEIKGMRPRAWFRSQGISYCRCFAFIGCYDVESGIRVNSMDGAGCRCRLRCWGFVGLPLSFGAGLNSSGFSINRLFFL